MQEDQLNVMRFKGSVTIVLSSQYQTTYDTHTDTFGLIENNMLCGPYEIRVLPRSVPENRNTAGLQEVFFIKHFI